MCKNLLYIVITNFSKNLRRSLLVEISRMSGIVHSARTLPLVYYIAHVNLQTPTNIVIWTIRARKRIPRVTSRAPRETGRKMWKSDDFRKFMKVRLHNSFPRCDALCSRDVVTWNLRPPPLFSREQRRASRYSGVLSTGLRYTTCSENRTETPSFSDVKRKKACSILFVSL